MDTTIKISIITTKGCEGCKIMENIVNNAVAILSEKDCKLVVAVADKDEALGKSIVASTKATDFPVVHFTNGSIKEHFVGTRPLKTVLNIINKLNK